jgi:hypothetical protein
MDIWFGTFREALPDEPEGPAPREDAKSTLRTVPTQEFLAYLSLSALSLGPWYYCSYTQTELSYQMALIPSVTAGFGPVLATFVSNVFNSSPSIAPKKMSIFGNILHLSMGAVFCSFPVAYTCWLTLNRV